MTLEVELSDAALDLHLTVERWLVRDYQTTNDGGCSYSVGLSENGHLVVISMVTESEEPCILDAYEYADFDSLSYGIGIAGGMDVPYELALAVARALMLEATG